MNHVSSVEIRKNFAKIMDDAKESPITIQKNGKDHIVMMSVKKYEELQALEDRMYGELAKSLDKEENFLSAQDSAKLLSKILDA